MAPATSSARLPTSNFHNAVASASVGAPAPAAISDETPTTLPTANVDPVRSAADVAHFPRPDYAIPPPNYSGVRHLVIVCCHAIFHPDASSPDFPLHTPYDERNWYLAPFQQSNPETGKPGEHETFLSHIQAGLDDITNGSYADRSLLVFSGGVTKPTLTSLSEARSYYDAALGWSLAQGQRAGGRARDLFEKGRILLEEYATDSFQNLLFSILLFRQTTGTYPSHIRVVTHAFKARRFLELHAPAIRWPTDRIQVQGVDPIMSKAEREETVRGEERYGYAPWQSDPFGTGEVLSQKRRQRGWNADMGKALGEGLEDGVQQLLHGDALESVPWAQPSSITRATVD